MRTFLIMCIFLAFPGIALLSGQTIPAGQEGTVLRCSDTGTWYMVERSNWSRYDDGAYTGLTHREVRAQVRPIGTTPKGTRYTGNFFVLEETLKDMTRSARGLDAIVEVDFTIAADGTITPAEEKGFPQLRGFPAYPLEAVHPGDRWQETGFRVIDPRNDGKKTVLPILVEYVFSGSETWNGRQVYRLKAQFATRLDRAAVLRGGDPSLTAATGSHSADILVDAKSGAALLVMDRVDETFSWSDGHSVRFKGNTAIFSENPVPLVRDTIIPRLRELGTTAGAAITDSGGTAISKSATGGDAAPSRSPFPRDSGLSPRSEDPVRTVDAGELLAAAKDSGSGPTIETEPFTVEETDKGVRLSVRDIRFKADSDEILTGEEWRLDAIAAALRLVEGGRFLVEGHTASTGNPSGEQKLSVMRAKRVVDAMIQRGISADRFMYTGYGGIYPVAGNETASGRAQNRRVEITILD
jgi:outer membrane protein OmpA-like peptidoglycan-associated protein